MMWLTLPVVAALITASPAPAQRPIPLVGQKVITKRPTPLTDGGRVVDHGAAYRVYTVERVEGDRLYLEWRGRRGWVLADSVIFADQAVEHFSREIAKDSTAWWAFARRGDALTLEGKHTGAMADFEEVIRLRPDLPHGFLGRACVRCKQEDFDKAIADLDKALALDPGSVEALLLRGSAWLMRDDYDRAIADLDKAALAGLEDASLHQSRGSARFLKGDTEGALADLDQAVRMAPGDPKCYAGRAFIRASAGQSDLALIDFDRAISIGPAEAGTYLGRANARYAKGDVAPALRDYQEAVRLDPKEGRAHESLAWIWATNPDAKHRDGKRAVVSAMRACELSEWKDASCLDTLAAAYAEVGNFAKAVESEEKAIKLFGADDERESGEARLRLFKDRKPYRDEG